jgi:hypothetical protein
VGGCYSIFELFFPLNTKILSSPTFLRKKRRGKLGAKEESEGHERERRR